MTLRIERIATEQALVLLRVSGRIHEDDVETLREVIGEEKGQVALDLTDVRLVDRQAVRFLAISEANGVELRNCAAYIREWIARESDLQHG